MLRSNYLFLLLLLAFISCNKAKKATLFTKVDPSSSGIKFRNLIDEKETFNIFKYQYYYNGGGVAVGDFNNDGLQDLVFTGNMVKNRLYLNKGNLKFEDITSSSHIAEKEGWCTGVTTVDINQDGWLDIYICRAGYPFEHLRRNLLYLNNGDLTFTESAAAYGIDDPAHSTHASFFDYDKDGDLDLYVANHSLVEYSRGSLDVFSLKSEKRPEYTNKLFRNENGKFSDVTSDAGISSNVLTFSLGLGLSDINLDGWPDIYVSNDFSEPDYLFINQKDGTFKERLTSYFDHTSLYSMGSDFADFNNDGLMDLFTADMLPESSFLQKMHMGADNYEKTERLINKGFFKQYMRNMLHFNNSDGTFSEIGQLAGVSNTDWSWAPLFFDFENDGDQDLFVSNGYLRDHTDMDFLKFTSDEVQRINQGKENIDFQSYMKKMPAIRQANYFYENGGQLNFINRTSDWSPNEPTVSQGAAYADLDNDGDLDIVSNNSGDYATLLANNTNKTSRNNYLKVKLLGPKGNSAGIGAKVYVYADGKTQYHEQFLTRGFQSSVDPLINFGLGTATTIDSLKVVWNTDQVSVLRKIAANQTLSIRYQKDSALQVYQTMTPRQTFTAVSEGIPFSHLENDYNDFKTQLLMPWMYSHEGPALAAGDLNADGIDDLFIGGGAGQAGQILVSKNQRYVKLSTPCLQDDALAEDVAASWFDADNDGDLDLYVVSGGYEFESGNVHLNDRLYLNKGNCTFEKTTNIIPQDAENGSCVATADADGDGDFDLFVGGAVLHGQYPRTSKSRFLRNSGRGKYNVVDVNLPGICKDAVWADLDHDKRPELIVACEWSAIKVLSLKNNQFEDKTNNYFTESPSGLWQSLLLKDLNNDGNLDLVAGNFGANTQLRASATSTLDLYVSDFDKNGTIDPLLCNNYIDGKHLFFNQEDIVTQLPFLRKRFLFFHEYAQAKIEDIFTPSLLKESAHYTVNCLETSIFFMKNGKFDRQSLPIESQFAPVQAIESADFNHDGLPDLVLGGNNYHVKVSLGSLDANHGCVLIGSSNGKFTYQRASESGICVKSVWSGAKAFQNSLIIVSNNQAPRLYKF